MTSLKPVVSKLQAGARMKKKRVRLNAGPARL
jgi:hypothetical protein